MYKLLLISFLLTSCIGSDNIEVVQYFEGTNKIKYKRIYKSLEDKELGNFIQMNYDADGVLVEEVQIKKNRLEGLALSYFDNGTVKSKGHYLHGVKEGIHSWYNRDGALITEKLYIAGDNVLLKNYAVFHNIKKEGYSVYRVKNDTALIAEGQLVFNDDGSYNREFSFYYITDIQDNLRLGDTCHFQIELFLGNSDAKSISKFRIGNIDINYKLTDTAKMFLGYEDVLNCYYIPREIGHKTLLGKIEIESVFLDYPKDTLFADFIFYKEITVVP